MLGSMIWVVAMYVFSALTASYVAVVAGVDAWSQRRQINEAPRDDLSPDAGVTFGELDVLATLARNSAANGLKTVFNLALTALSAVVGSAASVIALFII